MKVIEPIELRKLRYGIQAYAFYWTIDVWIHCHLLGDIPEALRMAEDALEEDPLQHYLRDTPVCCFRRAVTNKFVLTSAQDADISFFREQWRLQEGLQLTRLIHKGYASTIGNSDAMVCW
jgi:hypothetical protein